MVSVLLLTKKYRSNINWIEYLSLTFDCSSLRWWSINFVLLSKRYKWFFILRTLLHLNDFRITSIKSVIYWLISNFITTKIWNVITHLLWDILEPRINTWWDIRYHIGFDGHWQQSLFLIYFLLHSILLFLYLILAWIPSILPFLFLTLVLFCYYLLLLSPLIPSTWWLLPVEGLA